MPAHWYYDRGALREDYGAIDRYARPRNPHPDSILWRSSYRPLNARGDILREQAEWWGRQGVHYHQFLGAGENTLNFRLALELFQLVRELGSYDADAWLERYIDRMLCPGWHCDTYVEEYHRHFFTRLARGIAPRDCGGEDIHIGGLAAVPALWAALQECEHPLTGIQAAVRTHVGLTHRARDVLSAADTLVRLLAAIYSGEGIRPALAAEGGPWFSARKSESWSRQPDAVVIGRTLSPACYIRDAFRASLHLAWKYADGFSDGIIANARVGGDNCHRGAVVGSLLGLAHGVPERWLEGLKASGELASRSASPR